MNDENKKSSCLVVEDVSAEREVILAALMHAGYEAEGYGQVWRAREHIGARSARGCPFDVVVLDLLLESDFEPAFDLIEMIRVSSPSTKIIVLSGHGTTEHAVRAVKAGALDFVEKPKSYPYTGEEVAVCVLPTIAKALLVDGVFMDQQRKQRLAALSEDQFIDMIVIPLLRKLGYMGVKRTPVHGQGEHGQDILPFYKYGDFRERLYYAAQVKAGDIVARKGHSSSASTVLDQARSAMTVSFVDRFDGSRKRIDRCLVICSGGVTADARRLLEDGTEGRRDIILIEADDILALLDNAGMLVCFDQLSTHDFECRSSGICESIRCHGAAIVLTADNMQDALVELLNALVGVGALSGNDQGELLSRLLNREGMGGTCGLNGVAWPHAKVPTVGRVVLGLGISREGILWDGLAGVAHLVLLGLIPDHEPEVWLHALRTTGMLDSEEVLKACIACDPEDVLRLIKVAEKKLSHTRSTRERDSL